MNQYVIANTILNIICCDKKSSINNSRTVICSLHETKVIVQSKARLRYYIFIQVESTNIEGTKQQVIQI